MTIKIWFVRKSSKRGKMQNKVVLYTRECVFCGGIFPRNIEGKFKKFLEDNNLQLTIKQIVLYDGWRLEANEIKDAFNIEIPFFFFNGKAIEMKVLFKDNEINFDLLNDFIKK